MKPLYRHLKITTAEAYNIIASINARAALSLKSQIMRRTTIIHPRDIKESIDRTYYYSYKRLLVSIKQQDLYEYFDKTMGLSAKGWEKYINIHEKMACYVACDNSRRQDYLLVSDSLRRTMDQLRDQTSDPDEINLYNCILYRTLLPWDNEVDRNFTINKSGEMTYCPKNKKTIMTESDNWEKTNRSMVKYGKGLLKMLEGIDYKFTESIIEKVVNNLKSLYMFNATFEVVSGEDIRKYYHWEMYAESNTASLGQSCMRHASCQDYFDVYVNNTDMLIAKNNNGKIIGRAILWRQVDINGEDSIKLMDRIYGNDSTVQAFKDWAKNNGYYHKAYQTYSDNLSIISPNCNKREVTMSVDIVGGPYTFMPYMDTFKYANNRYDTEFTINNDRGNYELTNTEGNTDEDDEDYVTTPDGDRIHIDEARWVETHDEYYHEDDVVYSDDRGEYLLRSFATEVGGEWYLTEDLIWINSRSEYVVEADAVWSDFAEENIHVEDAVTCATTGVKIHIDDAVLHNDNYYLPNIDLPNDTNIS